MGNTLDDLKEFLKTLQLSTYEVNCYLNLLLEQDLTAIDLSKRSNVPTGRIYDVLNRLVDLGLVELHWVRPKRYRAISLSAAFTALLIRKEADHKGDIQLLYHQAQDLETAITTSNLLPHPPENKTFWSSAFGISPVIHMYQTHIHEIEQGFLGMGFINEHTEQVLASVRDLFDEFTKFLAHRGQVRFLWSFDFDERDLTDAQKADNDHVFQRICQVVQDGLHLSLLSPAVEMKYMHTRIPIYFDLFDRTRAIIKLRNPFSPSQIISCITILDREIVNQFVRYFDFLWFSHAIA
ncbi:MAG: putative transcriptional regulator [Promethearchaeota archaeon CR_4]|nr:MAG: putative transcriptional regulator [Candidatus Lokiarchaeota archaeon CR_4]